MDRKQVEQVVNQAILEMLEEEDSSLIELMMKHEAHLTNEEVDKETFVESTKKVLIETMKMEDVEVIEESEEAPEEDLELIEETEETEDNPLLQEEVDRMKKLFG